jgi:hypothetical protein
MRIQRYFTLGLAWFSLGPCAFSQPSGQDVRALAAFQDVLKRDGFDVNPGVASPINLVERWCTNTLPAWLPFNHALYSNSQPYLVVAVPKSASDPGNLFPLFKLGPAEAIVLIGMTPSA